MNGIAALPHFQQAELTILYGSSTGNSMRLARKTAAMIRERGGLADVHDLAKYHPLRLYGESRVVIVIGTWGDGEPPDAARMFCTKIFAGCLAGLDHLEYAVLALGDSCFPNFCSCGVKLDECLARHGARRLLDCRKLDIPFHDDFSRWQADFLERLRPSRHCF